MMLLSRIRGNREWKRIEDKEENEREDRKKFKNCARVKPAYLYTFYTTYEIKFWKPMELKYFGSNRN